MAYNIPAHIEIHPLTLFFTKPVILMLLLTQGGDYPRVLEQWYVTAPPEEGSDQWFAANADVDHEWVVTPGDNGPRVHKGGLRKENPSSLPFAIQSGSAKEGLFGERTIAKVDDGWIVGFNAGEFGAGLWWFSPHGDRRYQISDDHIMGLIPTSSGLVGIEGLVHGSVSKGRVVRISRKTDGPWKTEPLLDLGHAPQVATKDADGSLVVATTRRLLRIFPASKKTVVILDKAFWGGLYPNSMVIAPSGTIFLGMRHGIARIEPKGRASRVSWLLPDQRAADNQGEDRFK
ncbi:SMP-30/gluconolactonase/LRE family protein [Singulisphaera acidiphila]|uniref:Gluconolactonase n=1 Tax=Singulisphaera acidiphila (strain ATCC BAA-1392 / DSM 18658 / VKM B-2454 / MOB10) TaxID=886293 RepID=L0DDZ2_SINAD|nr:hypothetical protein [Singulisphaera acidiphila]AGA26861.1 hypothetical protein Sinac_2555 [Singulisphaera acidiphila DSM 18658]